MQSQTERYIHRSPCFDKSSTRPQCPFFRHLCRDDCDHSLPMSCSASRDLLGALRILVTRCTLYKSVVAPRASQSPEPSSACACARTQPSPRFEGRSLGHPCPSPPGARSSEFRLPRLGTRRDNEQRVKARAAVPPSDSKGFSNADTNKRIRLSLRETRSDKAWPSGADRERGRETERARSGRERERE